MWGQRYVSSTPVSSTSGLTRGGKWWRFCNFIEQQQSASTTTASGVRSRVTDLVKGEVVPLDQELVLSPYQLACVTRRLSR
jgi:hypothetical protein